ncbi:MAG: MBL fold metallo-hydrolase [Defluviitaleaceae bacterium]|nr:MBL fold metallo-hydrolase [Defluviitaleaceae bacterium]MCL2275345.1 MBL fold metallo-hydrolase [Defluviitaleaceae bacterium]
MRVKIYGCRGSVPLSHVNGSAYGGNTSCMTVQSSGIRLVVDAGSGMMQLFHESYARDIPFRWSSPCHILLSHLHFDHMIGLGTFQASWKNYYRTTVYTASRDERPLVEQIVGAFQQPYWPYSLAEACKFDCIAVEHNTPFTIEHFTITPFWANHGDMTYSFHITDGRRTFVYLLDSETEGMSDAAYDELLSYCKDADLVVFDAAYAPDDYPRYKGWGHSTVVHGIELARACAPKRVLFSHFAQHYTDEQLDTWAQYYKNEACSEFIMAREGMVVRL